MYKIFYDTFIALSKEEKLTLLSNLYRKGGSSLLTTATAALFQGLV